MKPTKILRASLLMGVLVMRVNAATALSDPDYQRDVRPILSRNCFFCHGPDDKARKAKLRLDLRDEAIKPAKSGEAAIVPGKPDKSELMRRILTTDHDDVMPPVESKKSLTAAEKETLRKWVASGADYKPHWAFAAPKQIAPPAVKQKGWVRNPIDNFILARLEKEKLKPSPLADDATMVRRLYLDLIGLPPTVAEADAFLKAAKSNRDAAVESLVDQLLASPHYGERWARKWLDLARYADTNGYEKDRPRNIWPWRDWVINALNADMPFDQFTIKQVAGDLLPNATLADRVATGLHRNTMLNEEGGIDPQEFRYYSMVDRVTTTGAAWLGLTMQCVQCHTHKFDPIPHREFYQMMAFLNNADEPDLDLPDKAVDERHQKNFAEAAKLLAGLEDKWPVDAVRPQVAKPVSFNANVPLQTKTLDDGSVLVTGGDAGPNVYMVTLETEIQNITQLRLNTIRDASLPASGPGRSKNGNFVLNEITVTAAPKDGSSPAQPVKLVKAEADFSQDNFPVANLIDGQPRTGWAVGGSGQGGKKGGVGAHAATLTFEKPVGFASGTRLVVRMEQNNGNQLTLGRFRFSVVGRVSDSRPAEVRRKEIVAGRFAEWLKTERARTANWTPVRPAEAKSNLPLLQVQPDDSVFCSGDSTKSDTYDLKFRGDFKGVTAIRLEALPDDRLPAHGPGMTDYEGPKGDFFLGEFIVSAAGQPLKFSKSSESYAKNNFGAKPVSAALATDGDPQTGWSCSGRFGERHVAVFNLAAPLGEVRELDLKMLFGRHFASSLGRFRISVTRDAAAEARDLSAETERLLAVPDEKLTLAQRKTLREEFLLAAPELAADAQRIRSLRKRPEYQTTLVLRERPPENPRPTHIHNRGEFLQPTEPVGPGVLSALNPLPEGAPRTRLTLAKWLVSPENPLTARVTVNRHWQSFFGNGIVRTTADFGQQGDMPSHPELLDWLAVEFVKQGWSMKKLHKLFVMSATYQQSSHVTLESLAKDPSNTLLSHAPRIRLEAEQIRDVVLRASGLLSEKFGGPSVFPPQPASVTSEGVYAGKAWNESTGADRYRRGLYTFVKRSAPFAMFNTFDAPNGEACVARREVSNTPLQALTLLNDIVFTEASQALGNTLAAAGGTVEGRVRNAFRRVATREASKEEVALLVKFYEAQKKRFETKELDAAKVAGSGTGDATERAAWTTVARALFNLDETITKG